MRVVKDQVIASTTEDSQGERCTREFLEDLCLPSDQRFPIGRGHDMSSLPVGYLTNSRLVPHPREPGEWQIIADLYYESEDVPLKGGISWARQIMMESNSQRPDLAIFLPWPDYNNQELIRSILSQPCRVTVGKWVKKSADPTRTALVTSLLIALLNPIYEDVYRNAVIPLIRQQVCKLKALWRKGITTDHMQILREPDGRELKVYFITGPKSRRPLRGSALTRGLTSARRRIREIRKNDQRAVRVVRLLYDRTRGRYRVLSVEFEDGGVSVVWNRVR